MEDSTRRADLFLLLTFVVAVWGGWLCLPSAALCDPKADGDKERAATQEGKRKGKDEQPAKRSLRMEEIEIHGDVEKPKTMFVIPRASLRYSRKDHGKDFTSEILDPVSKEWVEDTQRWRGAVPPP